MRAPKELQRYVVYSKIEVEGGIKEAFKYFLSFREAKAYGKTLEGKVRVFKIVYEDKGQP